jgi:hypothetical protein
VYEASRAQIAGAIHALVERAIESGVIHKDLEPFDLLRALIGVSNVASGPDWQPSSLVRSQLKSNGPRCNTRILGRDRGY